MAKYCEFELASLTVSEWQDILKVGDNPEPKDLARLAEQFFNVSKQLINSDLNVEWNDLPNATKQVWFYKIRELLKNIEDYKI